MSFRCRMVRTRIFVLYSATVLLRSPQRHLNEPHQLPTGLTSTSTSCTCSPAPTALPPLPYPQQQQQQQRMHALSHGTGYRHPTPASPSPSCFASDIFTGSCTQGQPFLPFFLSVFLSVCLSVYNSQCGGFITEWLADGLAARPDFWMAGLLFLLMPACSLQTRCKTTRQVVRKTSLRARAV